MQQRALAPYEVLGVSPTATQEEINAAYKVLAQIFHPDRFEDSPEPVRREAEARMKTLNEAYAAARSGSLLLPPSGNGDQADASPQETPRGPGGRAWAGAPWDLAVRERAAQAARAERARRERERAARQGNAVGRPRSAVVPTTPRLNGLGLARFTNNIVCSDCGSVQWLPSDWRERLDDTSFFCSVCDRLIFSR